MERMYILSILSLVGIAIPSPARPSLRGAKWGQKAPLLRPLARSIFVRFACWRGARFVAILSVSIVIASTEKGWHPFSPPLQKRLAAGVPATLIRGQTRRNVQKSKPAKILALWLYLWRTTYPVVCGPHPLPPRGAEGVVAQRLPQMARRKHYVSQIFSPIGGNSVKLVIMVSAPP